MTAAQYVGNLRRKLKEGNPLSPEEAAYLQEYERRVKRGRKPGQAPPLPEEPKATETKAGPAETPRPAGPAKEPPPINLGASNGQEQPSGDGGGKESNGSGGNGTGDAGSGAGVRPGPDDKAATDSSKGAESAGPTPEEVEQYKAMAFEFCSWQCREHEKFAKAGFPHLSQEIIQKVVFPATVTALIKGHSYVKPATDFASPIIAAGSGLFTLVVKRRYGMWERQQANKAAYDRHQEAQKAAEVVEEQPPRKTEPVQPPKGKHPDMPSETALEHVPSDLVV